MAKKYESPLFEEVELKVEDVIMTSPNGEFETDDDFLGNN